MTGAAAVTSLEPSLVVEVATALGIGALIGIERERSDSAGAFAGSRTFPLFALLGALTGAYFPSLLPVVGAVVGLVAVSAYVGKVTVVGDLGTTTTAALLLTFVYGAMTTHSAAAYTMAVVLGVLTTAVLAAKGPVHEFADRLEREEFRATLQFLIVSLVVLPLLPDRSLPALLGLNPRFVWLMVVFVSGISLLAYLLSQYLGTERGVEVTGLLGGFVSSTATSASMAQHTSDKPALWPVSGVAVVVASTAMFPRALLEVSVVNPALVSSVAVPLLAMTATGGLLSGVTVLWFYARESVDIELENPFRLRPALLFGLIFAIVLLASEQVSIRYGARGIYVASFVSGLADVDAMTLSLSRLAQDGTVTTDVAATGIVLAAASNTIVKAGIAWVLGTRKLGLLVTGSLAVTAAVGLVTVTVV